MTSMLLARPDLRAALGAVVVHAHADDDHRMHRVRLQIASSDTVVLSAVDGYTAAAAAVPADEVATDELPVVDLPVQSVRDVLAVFKPPSGKDAQAAWNAAWFRLTVSDDDVTVTEAGAFLDGTTLIVPRHPAGAEDYPDVAAFLTSALLAGTERDADVHMNAAYLTRFVSAAKIYAEPLVARPIGKPRGLHITVGDRFTGVLATINPEPPTLQQTAAAREQWTDRLAFLAGAT